jgi:hypothetical protein
MEPVCDDDLENSFDIACYRPARMKDVLGQISNYSDETVDDNIGS